MRSEISQCLSQCRRAFISLAALSGVANVFALTGSIFMLAVYDRVIPSGSVPTLVSLGLIALLVYVFMAFIDIARGWMLTRIGLIIEESLTGRTYDLLVRKAASGSNEASGVVRDLDQVRGFLSSMGPTALFDLPWIPIYLAICFSFHWAIGLTVVAGALILVALTLVSEVVTKQPSKNLHEAQNRRFSLMQASQNNAETLQAMGMTLAMSGSWRAVSGRIVEVSRVMADMQTVLSTTSRTFRMVLQSFVLSVGAYLVINQDATGGIMIASSILSSRALAPIELSIAHWKSFVAARQSRTRLDELLQSNPPEHQSFAIPAPQRTLTCEQVSLSPPNVGRTIVHNVSFGLRAGEGLGIIGATGSGKSTLVRSLVGLWPPLSGVVRLDGSPLNQWSSTQRGRFIGYLPQRVALFEGTIAQNIARFDPDAEPDRIVSVARSSGIHEMIARLPNGYDTMIGEGGTGLSGGQSQRVGLARALYGDPFLLVLDEPNSNLDHDGELALQNAMMQTRARGGIVIIVAHRPSALSAVDHVLVMHDGRVQQMGPRDEILQSMMSRPAAPPVTAASAA
ncbi:type I secretion system permease/ATPase [Antarcticirhabdus aurantiaca]|uniref:Type I secretion system permease/ATPase n=1 Tax=Antarcticirhabdus aurantiaca TaxID=2606717 RepID=A0ACD4NR09_9HYPH|nr:type I secretion system permease/ATPase [Antarcticirhabdus aurantiaca]WAJ29179.1 type I secretion system permease/ATPase [Jeongeuplla avenae]